MDFFTTVLLFQAPFCIEIRTYHEAVEIVGSKLFLERGLFSPIVEWITFVESASGFDGSEGLIAGRTLVVVVSVALVAVLLVGVSFGFFVGLNPENVWRFLIENLPS